MAAVFDRPWSVSYYWPGNQMDLIRNASQADRRFLASMLAVSIPFVWVGIDLVVRRLRSIGLPLWLSLMFFVPVLNLVFFALLSILPETDKRIEDDVTCTNTVPVGNSLARRLITVLVGAGLGAALSAVGVYGIGGYGVGLFVSLPFCLGMIIALCQGYSGERTFKNCVILPMVSMIIIALLLLLLSLEGAGCLLMVIPIWLFCAALGGVVGYFILRSTREEKAITVAIVVLALLVPVVMGAEALLKSGPAVIAVRTVVEIDAEPEEVWRRVIAFPPLPEPTEFYFRIGVAYPTDATIVGHGVGAERRCNFSTGTFVEPIKIWDEPRLLKFSVTENPPPLREFSFYQEIHPPHLDGFLVSRSGQFRLTRLESGKTLLEGTTWYQNDMAPSAYWRLWSDAIIHRIHLRVLRHIKYLSESVEVVDRN